MFKNKTSTGLFINAESVHLVQVNKVLGQFRATGSASLSWPANMPEESAEKTEPIRETVIRAFKEARIQSRNVYLAVPGEDSIMRSFELPLLPKKEQRNAIRFEAQKYVPFEIRDLYLDYEIIPDPAHKRMKVVISAVRRHIIENLATALHTGEVRVVGTELVSHSIARSFAHFETKQNQAVTAVIQANDNQTAEVVICKNANVFSHRHIALAKLADSTELDTGYLTAEIRLCFDSFVKTFKTEKVEKIQVYSGYGVESLSHLPETLRQEFGLPVQEEKSPVFQGLRPAQESAGMTIAFGLACRDLGTAKVKGEGVNLFSSAAVKPKEEAVLALSWGEERARLQNFAVKEIVLIALLLFGLFVFLFHTLSSKRNALERLRASYPKSSTISAEMPLLELEERQRELAQKTGFLTKLVDERPYFTMKLNQLAHAVPTNVALTRLDYSDDVNKTGSSELRLRLEGYVLTADAASDLSLINKMVSQLSSDKEFMSGFNEIKISSAKKSTVDSRPVTAFTVDCAGRMRT